MSELKVMIGLELHVQLNTKSKLFCACKIPEETDSPNSITCEICLGHPGSKPSLNEFALELAMRAAISLNCSLNQEFYFSRKIYFYPDLAKNFQITQYELPIAEKGFLELSSGKKIGITRIHLEEDPAKLIHEHGVSNSNCALIDYNRSGVPLIEIVTDPVISSPAEAREFLNKLILVLDYIEVFNSKGTLKADCNISLNEGNRVEIKNISGVKEVEKALNYEILRQKHLLNAGKEIERETRAFVNNKTISLRKKESEADYGYIFEPDLPVFVIYNQTIDYVKSKIPELAQEKIKRLQKEFNLKEYDAKVLASSKKLADLFEVLVKTVNKDLALSFLIRDFLGVLNYNKISINDFIFNPVDLIELIVLIEQNKVSSKNAKEALIKFVLEGKKPVDYLKENDLLIDKDFDLNLVVEEILKENQKAVNDFKNGSKKSLNFLQGLVMKRVKGKVDSKEVRKVLLEKLN